MKWTKSQNLSVCSEQGSQGGVDIKNPNIPLLQAVANVRPVDRNLAAQHQLRIRAILGDGGDFKLRLNLPRQPHVNVVDGVIATQMPPLRQLTARHSHRNPRRGRHHREFSTIRGQRSLRRKRRRLQFDAARLRLWRTKEGHDSGAWGGIWRGVRVERGCRIREGALLVEVRG